MNPSVAVIMTVRGEQPERLARRLAEIAVQDQPVVEVVIAVPAAEHPAISALAPVGAPFVLRLVDNPTGQRSPGLNLAAQAATAEILVRVDARSSVSAQYLRTLVGVLVDQPEVGMVGGPQLPIPGGASAVARGVARALANPWALGGAAYRRIVSGPVETVYLGAFRRTQLLELGGYDERLEANEDFELCQRFRQRGMVVWLVSQAAVSYESRTTLAAVAAQYLAFGRSKVVFWRLSPTKVPARQVVAIGGAAAGLMVLGWAAMRPRRLPLVAAGGLAALALVDRLGAPTGPTPPKVRVVAMATYPIIWASWLLGIFTEALHIALPKVG